MTSQVNPPGSGRPLRQAQVAHTEQRILAAATELFLADGYLATTLAATPRIITGLAGSTLAQRKLNISASTGRRPLGSAAKASIRKSAGRA